MTSLERFTFGSQIMHARCVRASIQRASGAMRGALVTLMAGAMAAVMALAPSAVRAQASPAAPYTIGYTVEFPDPASHLYHVSVDVAGILQDSVVLHFPVWSPGRYARMEFARLVQHVEATDGNGAPLAWEKIDGSRWRVITGSARPATVRFRYQYFANRLSGTFSVLDTAHANWNGPSLFPWVEGHKADPVTLNVETPDGWQLMNGHADTPEQRAFRFPTYDEFIDTPTEVAPRLVIDSFRTDGITYRMVLHHNGDPADGTVAKALGDLQKIVAYQNTVMGPPPIERYTFLLNIGYQGGDGMEHLNSTQVMTPQPWTEVLPVLPAMGTNSHEYFHVWNVKRIRPAALGPFDYSRAIHQPSLWVAEGWTNYYGNITFARAGITDGPTYLRGLSNVIRVTSETPGRKERSARQASYDATFFDGANDPMPVNRSDVFLTYYVKGEALAAFLDLTIRAHTNGQKSLDDVLRLLKARTWDAPTDSYYLQGRGYTERDIEEVVSDVMGRDMTPWFDQYVGGTDDLPWDEALAGVGLALRITEAEAGRRYEVIDRPNATTAQRRLRASWLGAP